MAEGTRGQDIKKLEVQMRDQEKAVQRVSNRTDEIANKTDDLLKLVAKIASQQSAMMQMMQNFGMNAGGSSVSRHDRDEQEPFNQPANLIPHQDPQQRPIRFGKVEFPRWRLYRYNFNKVAQYKQPTLEEAEEKMKKRKKTVDGDDDEDNASDRGAGDDNEKDGSSRKSKLRGGDDDDDDDDEAPRGRDPDMEDEEEEKGDDWEHNKHFRDDDESLDVEEEQEDLANEAVPPEIKDDEDEEDTAATGGSYKGVSPASKGKRKLNSDDGKPCSNAPSSKKTKNDSSEAKSSDAKDGQQHPSKGASKSSSDSKAAAATTGPVTEEEIKSFLMQNTPVAAQVLVGKFKFRLPSKEDKDWFAGILRKISNIQKTNGSIFIVLK